MKKGLRPLVSASSCEVSLKACKKRQAYAIKPTDPLTLSPSASPILKAGSATLHLFESPWSFASFSLQLWSLSPSSFLEMSSTCRTCPSLTSRNSRQTEDLAIESSIHNHTHG